MLGAPSPAGRLPWGLAQAAAPLLLGALWSAAGTPWVVTATCTALLVVGAGGLWFAGLPRETGGTDSLEVAA